MKTELVRKFGEIYLVQCYDWQWNYLHIYSNCWMTSVQWLNFWSPLRLRTLASFASIFSSTSGEYKEQFCETMFRSSSKMLYTESKCFPLVAILPHSPAFRPLWSCYHCAHYNLLYVRSINIDDQDSNPGFYIFIYVSRCRSMVGADLI